MLDVRLSLLLACVMLVCACSVETIDQPKATDAGPVDDRSTSVPDLPLGNATVSTTANDPLDDAGEWSTERISSEVDSMLTSIGEVAIICAELF